MDYLDLVTKKNIYLKPNNCWVTAQKLLKQHNIEATPGNANTFWSLTARLTSSDQNLQVRGVEVGIVVLVLLFWVGAIILFFNRWGKIRMLLPYQPDYKDTQLKVPGTGASGACPSTQGNGFCCSQVSDLCLRLCLVFWQSFLSYVIFHNICNIFTVILW